MLHEAISTADEEDMPEERETRGTFTSDELARELQHLKDEREKILYEHGHAASRQRRIIRDRIHTVGGMLRALRRDERRS